MLLRVFAVVGAIVTPLPLVAQDAAGLLTSVQQQLPSLTETYKHLHRNPELSHNEEKTSAYLAGELRTARQTGHRRHPPW